LVCFNLRLAAAFIEATHQSQNLYSIGYKQEPDPTVNPLF